MYGSFAGSNNDLPVMTFKDGGTWNGNDFMTTADVKQLQLRVELRLLTDLFQ
jgi:hypothetical protein